MQPEFEHTTMQQWSDGASRFTAEDRLLILSSAEDLWTNSGSVVKTGMAGRGNVRRVELADGVRVIVREFLRGGVLARFCRRSFLRPLFRARKFLPNEMLVSGYRPFDELRVLEFLRRNGAAVPNPVAAFISETFFTYRGLIVVEEIPESRNLLDILGEKSESRFADIAAAVGREAWKILNLGVQHADLHIGNVLLTSGNEIILIDFDKATFLRNGVNREDVRKSLINRWSRSCRKHGCEEMIKPFSEGMLDG
jgi:tRNA A-37 threonylcarbamoyl transferase component Bud32